CADTAGDQVMSSQSRCWPVLLKYSTSTFRNAFSKGDLRMARRSTPSRSRRLSVWRCRTTPVCHPEVVLTRESSISALIAQSPKFTVTDENSNCVTASKHLQQKCLGAPGNAESDFGR